MRPGHRVGNARTGVVIGGGRSYPHGMTDNELDALVGAVVINGCLLERDLGYLVRRLTKCAPEDVPFRVKDRIKLCKGRSGAYFRGFELCHD